MNQEDWHTCHGADGEGVYYVNRRTRRATKTPWMFGANGQLKSTQSTTADSDDGLNAPGAQEEYYGSYSNDSDDSDDSDDEDTPKRKLDEMLTNIDAIHPKRMRTIASTQSSGKGN